MPRILDPGTRSHDALLFPVVRDAVCIAKTTEGCTPGDVSVGGGMDDAVMWHTDGCRNMKRDRFVSTRYWA